MAESVGAAYCKHSYLCLFEAGVDCFRNFTVDLVWETYQHQVEELIAKPDTK